VVSMGPYTFTQCGAEILISTVCCGVPAPSGGLQTTSKPSSWRSCGSRHQDWQQYQLLHGCEFLQVMSKQWLCFPIAQTSSMLVLYLGNISL